MKKSRAEALKAQAAQEQTDRLGAIEDRLVGLEKMLKDVLKASKGDTKVNKSKSKDEAPSDQPQTETPADQSQPEITG